MKTIAHQLDAAFRAAIRAAFDLDADPLITASQNDKFGDYQSNAAMGLAKLVTERTGQKTNPRAVAEQILAKLDLGGMADGPPDKNWIAGPGFINVRLSPRWVAAQLAAAAKDDRLGVEAVEVPQTVVVDYSGPNVAKEMHVGHIRSTILGDAVARVLEFRGDRVIRQNHLGDWGTQFGMLIAELRSVGGGAEHIEDLEAFYVQAKKRFDAEPAFADEARQTVVQLQAGGSDELGLWQRIVAETRRHYQAVYETLGVGLKQSDERGESFYNPYLADVVRELRAKGLAVESEGAIAVFADGPGKAPLIVEKSGGGFLYGTTDLAALRYRTEQLHANRVLYFVDARQSQHFQQVFATARKAGWAEGVALEHAAFGTMLGPDGKPFKSRTGGTVKLKDLLGEAEERAFALVTEKNPELPEDRRKAIAHAVGIGGVKYADLSKDRTSDYMFSFDAMLATDGNTAPYMQYAYARVRSIFRKAAEREISYAGLAAATFDVSAPQEIALAKQILRFGETVEGVARELKPHLLCAYLYDLAGKYSSFYEACPVLTSEEPTRTSRLALADLTARTLAKGLDLLGIEHPEQM
ncbi:MAG: arginine--tRNA ligase [Phycisphaerales bacterium]|nr:arginine--tRNA ligase [Phycisphaerales bacterium]